MTKALVELILVLSATAALFLVLAGGAFAFVAVLAAVARVVLTGSMW